jgi:hypothetical protein
MSLNPFEKAMYCTSVKSDCVICRSKNVTCLCVELRGNFVTGSHYHDNCGDTAIHGDEKHVCCLCVTDIFLTATNNCVKTPPDIGMDKPPKAKKVKTIPAKELPFDVDAYEQKRYIDYRLKGYSNIQIAKKLKITEDKLSEKIEVWIDREAKEIINRKDITEEERTHMNEEMFKFYKVVCIYE